MLRHHNFRGGSAEHPPVVATVGAVVATGGAVVVTGGAVVVTGGAVVVTVGAVVATGGAVVVTRVPTGAARSVQHFNGERTMQPVDDGACNS